MVWKSVGSKLHQFLVKSSSVLIFFYVILPVWDISFFCKTVNTDYSNVLMPLTFCFFKILNFWFFKMVTLFVISDLLYFACRFCNIDANVWVDKLKLYLAYLWWSVNQIKIEIYSLHFIGASFFTAYSFKSIQVKILLIWGEWLNCLVSWASSWLILCDFVVGWSLKLCTFTGNETATVLLDINFF